MASEIRVDKINSLSGVGTVTLSPTGVDIAGITTAATLKATTGIVTTLTATTGIVTTLTANTTTHLDDVSFTGASYNMTWDKSDNSLIVNDNARVKFGTGKDLHIYHNESNSVIREEGTGNLNLQTTGGNVEILVATTETAAKFISDGAVELYHDNSKRLETTSAGIKLLGSGTDAIEMTGDVWFNNNEHAGADIYFNSGDKRLIYEDNVKAVFGGGGDLKIYHDGSHSYIEDSGTGNLRVLTNSFTVNNTANSANLAQFTEGGSVELFYDGTKQCETSTNGLAFPSGKGINFSATGDAAGASGESELLDDFEEGNYTVGVYGSNGGSSISVYDTENKLSYTKIGNLVTVKGRIRMNAVSYSGSLRISLPYTVASQDNTNNAQMCAVATHGADFDSTAGTGSHMGMFLEPLAGNTLAEFNVTRDNSSWTQATNSIIVSGTYLAFVLVYNAT